MRQSWDAYEESAERGPLSLALRGLVGLLTVAVVLGAFGVGYRYVFGTAGEEVRREIYEESQAHVQGTIRHLQRLRLEYESTESEARKRAIRQLALTQASEVDDSDLTESVRAWIRSLR